MESEEQDAYHAASPIKYRPRFLEQVDSEQSHNPSELRTIIRQNMRTQVLNKVNHNFHDQTPQILNQQLQSVFVSLVLYQEQIYRELKAWDFYLENQEEFHVETAKIVIEEIKDNYRKIIDKFKQAMEESFTQSLKQLSEDFQGNINAAQPKDRKIVNYKDAFKSSKTYLMSIMKENTARILGDTPSEVFFLVWYAWRIQENVRDVIVTKGLSKILWQDHRGFKSTVYKELTQIFKTHFAKDKVYKIFDPRSLGRIDNTVTLFNIVLTTNYLELNENKSSLYFATLQKLYVTFMVDYTQKFTEIGDNFQLLEAKFDNPIRTSKDSDKLNFYKNQWNSSVNRLQNLTALMNIFLAFNFVTNGSLYKTYSSHTRYMLGCLFKNLGNGETQFTNFQMLCCMEYLLMSQAKDITKVSEDTMQMERLKMTIAENLHENFKRANSMPVHNYIDQEAKNDETINTPNHVDVQKHIVDIQNSQAIKAEHPEIFDLERQSEDKIRSKTVIICISGFTPEDSIKSKEWRPLCQIYPYTEVFSLNWGATAVADAYYSILKTIRKTVKHSRNTHRNFTLDWTEILSRSGLSVYNLIKTIKNGAWDRAHEEAVKTGVYLAHIIAKTEIFRGYSVNLIGFSLGSVVVMSCIRELGNMGRNDIIYDVLMMGGVNHNEDINKAILGSISNRLINCYSRKDYLLRYMLKMINPSTSPIGVGRVLPLDKKVKNVSFAEWVTCHSKYKEILYELMIRTDFNENVESILFG